MGCGSSKSNGINIEEEYTKKGLPLPETLEYENNFEKEAYMTMNLLRNDPKFFIP